jgi:DNA helicase TIP49 (TBP-interacting protein)
LQTTERYLQAIDPRFRETMRLLEGDVLSLLIEKPTHGTDSPTQTLTQGIIS